MRPQEAYIYSHSIAYSWTLIRSGYKNATCVYFLFDTMHYFMCSLSLSLYLCVCVLVLLVTMHCTLSLSLSYSFSQHKTIHVPQFRIEFIDPLSNATRAPLSNVCCYCWLLAFMHTFTYSFTYMQTHACTHAYTHTHKYIRIYERTHQCITATTAILFDIWTASVSEEIV